MADMAVQSDVMEAAGPYDRAKALSAFKLGDLTFYWITRISAISVLLILGGIILSLIVGAWPAMKEYGFAFLWTQRWAPSADPPVLGALGPIYGTLITSVIAMLIAIPVGIGIAVFLTELCPQVLRRPIGIAIELLAGIPSIIYGMWGFFVLGPFLANTFQPFMIRIFEGVPVLGAVFAGPPSYLSLFNAALILAIMVLPFITAISVDVFKTVPPVLKEAAYGMGCTTWEGRSQRRDPLHPRRGDRRHHACARPRPRRDHGSDLHHRQLVPDLVVDLRAGHHDLGGDR
ncbi:phosphate ABC transporter permease protein PstC [Bradyrhizobium elkanii]